MDELAMEEVLDQIRELCAGKAVEEIEQELTESSHADRITDKPAMAKYFFALANGDEEEPVAGPEEDLPDDN